MEKVPFKRRWVPLSFYNRIYSIYFTYAPGAYTVKQNLCRERVIQPHTFLRKVVYVAGFVKKKKKNEK